MLVSEALSMLGGIATRPQLVDLTSRKEVDDALDRGEIVRAARNRYQSPEVDGARGVAHRLTGVVGLLSAALIHGWAVKTAPKRPQVIVGRGRKLTAAQTVGVEIHRMALDADDVVDGVTSRDRTLLDCGRSLPDDEVLCVFDSALRSGFSHTRLLSLMRDARGPGVKRMRALALRATSKSANPFETCLRELADRVVGLEVQPQVELYGDEFLGRPDLVDRSLRVVLEADSFEWHGGRADLANDARRYNRMIVNGWLVLRFAWEDVMFDPGYVLEILEAVVRERTKVCVHCGWAA